MKQILGVANNFVWIGDEYRAKAEEAQREADRSTSELQRAAWQRIVRGGSV
jgi:hypothetical protein